MPRHKRLVLTFDAFGTLFTPRESIGQQYVCTFVTVHRFNLIDETCFGHGKGFAFFIVLDKIVTLLRSV